MSLMTYWVSIQHQSTFMTSTKSPEHMIYIEISVLIITAIVGSVFYLEKKIGHIEELFAPQRTPLTKESLLKFIREEKTIAVNAIDDSPYVVFKYGDDKFGLDTSRLPQQFIMLKSYDISEDPNKDLMLSAATKVTESIVVAKVLKRDDRIDFKIVTMDHTVEQIRENFDAYMSLIADAERRFFDEVERQNQFMDLPAYD